MADHVETRHAVSADDFRRRRRGRNWMLALILLAFVVLFYFVTIVKLTSNIA